MYIFFVARSVVRFIRRTLCGGVLFMFVDEVFVCVVNVWNEVMLSVDVVWDVVW